VRSRPEIVSLAGAVLLAAIAVAARADDEPERRPAAKDVSPTEAVVAGARWLVEHQNPDGSWGTHRTGNSYNIWCDVPGGHEAFRIATTGLATMALRGLAPERRTEETEKAAARGLACLIATGPVKRSQPAQLYNVWANPYALRALAESILDPREGEDPAPARRAAKEILAEIGATQFLSGGWGYFDFFAHTARPSGDAMSFTTATTLIALHRSREAGIDVPEGMIRKAISCLRRCRNPDGSWIYSTGHTDWRRGLINRPKGSLSRTPACAAALRMFTGEPDLDEIRTGLRRLVRHHRFAVAAVRRPIPHESWYSNSGYFYLYGYAYAVLALEMLPEKERAAFREPLARAVMDVREPDGCFWDYPLYDYHRAYGTAYALLALERLARIPAEPPGEGG
jgi:hypothetical protein